MKLFVNVNGSMSHVAMSQLFIHFSIFHFSFFDFTFCLCRRVVIE